jgi:hypothetical protein
MHIILAAREAAIRRIIVQSQPGQIVQETLSWKKKKKPIIKKGWWRVAQGVGPEFKSQYHKKTKKRVLEDIAS